MEATAHDPRYVQVDKREAARVLGCTVKDLDRLRRSDPRFPVGHTRTDSRNSKIRFRLSDIYRYSEELMGE